MNFPWLLPYKPFIHTKIAQDARGRFLHLLEPDPSGEMKSLHTSWPRPCQRRSSSSIGSELSSLAGAVAAGDSVVVNSCAPRKRPLLTTFCCLPGDARRSCFTTGAACE